VVTIHTTFFDIYKLFILASECIHAFDMILRINHKICLNCNNWLVIVIKIYNVFYEVGT
jgi:hypothetical protein